MDRYLLQFRLMSSNDSGASALEYGLVVGLIALVIIAGLTLAGGSLSTLFNYIGNELSNIAPSA